MSAKLPEIHPSAWQAWVQVSVQSCWLCCIAYLSDQPQWRCSQHHETPAAIYLQICWKFARLPACLLYTLLASASPSAPAPCTALQQLSCSSQPAHPQKGCWRNENPIYRQPLFPGPCGRSLCWLRSTHLAASFKDEDPRLQDSPQVPPPLRCCSLLQGTQKCLGWGLDWKGTKTVRLKIPHQRGLRFFVLSKINSWESAVVACAACWWIRPGRPLCQELLLRSSPKKHRVDPEGKAARNGGAESRPFFFLLNKLFFPIRQHYWRKTAPHQLQNKRTTAPSHAASPRFECIQTRNAIQAKYNFLVSILLSVRKVNPPSPHQLFSSLSFLSPSTPSTIWSHIFHTSLQFATANAVRKLHYYRNAICFQILKKEILK